MEYKPIEHCACSGSIRRKMRVAILVSWLPPKWLAGTEIATYNIAEFLTKSGHEVHIVTGLDKG